jgi:hypothetical protein
MRLCASSAAAVALVSWLCLPGCSSEDAASGGKPSAPSGDEALAPPPEGQGFQLHMQTDIAPGFEGEWCKLVMGPEEDFYLNRDEVRFTKGSHHFLLYETSYTEIPTENDDGEPIDTSGVFDCSEGATAGWSVVRLLGGSQNGDGESINRFPPDVAMRVPGKRALLMNAHYLNATPDVLEPEVAINVWTVPSDQVTTEGDLLFLYNPFIKVAANGSGRARWRCPVHEDITLGNVQSHMHKRGVGFAGAIEGEAPFYENDKWDDVPVKVFSPGMQIRGGSRLDYYCDYQSSEARDVYQGARTTDEMCMLVGPYWPADPRTSNCLDKKGDIAGEWVGNGTTGCADTWSCLVDTFDEEDVVSRISDCLDASSPDVSAEVSSALRCVIHEGALEGCEAQIAACEAK